MRPALVYRHIVGGAQTVTQDQDFDFLLIRVTRVVNAEQYEQNHD